MRFKVSQNKMYKKFIKDLLKHSETHNAYFTEQQIPNVFKGWSDVEFQKIHQNIGSGCCTFLGEKPGYRINVNYCNDIYHKFNESRKTTIRIWLTIIAVLIGAVGLYFKL